MSWVTPCTPIYLETPDHAGYPIFVVRGGGRFEFQPGAGAGAPVEDPRDDPQFQISLLEEAFSNFHRYFFIMPILAQFELEVHQRLEGGQGLTAEDMNAIMADLSPRAMARNSSLTGTGPGLPGQPLVTCIRITMSTSTPPGSRPRMHFHAESLSGAQNAAEDYLRFLSAGNSLYPLEALKLAGVDMSTPQPVEETFDILAQMVDRLEELTKINERST